MGDLREARGLQLVSLGARWAVVAVAVVAGSVILGGSVVSAQRPALPAYLALGHVDTVNASEALPPPDASPTPEVVASATRGRRRWRARRPGANAQRQHHRRG